MLTQGPLLEGLRKPPGCDWKSLLAASGSSSEAWGKSHTTSACLRRSPGCFWKALLLCQKGPLRMSLSIEIGIHWEGVLNGSPMDTEGPQYSRSVFNKPHLWDHGNLSPITCYNEVLWKWAKQFTLDAFKKLVVPKDGAQPGFSWE